MRVLHVMPSLARAYGGPTQSLLGYLHASACAGIRATVVAPACADDDRRWFVEQLPEGCDVRTFAAHGPGHLRVAPGIVRAVRGGAGEYDAVHVHGVFNSVSALGGRAALAAGIPLVVRPFGTLSRYTFAYRRSLPKRLWFRLLEAPTLRRAAAIHFTTETERLEADRPELRLGTRGVVVPPPWRGEARPPRLVESGPGRRVLFLSRLHPVKGLELLLDAWPLVLRERPDARLVIAGDGDPEYVASLRARMVQIGAAARAIELPGFVNGSAKADCLAAADVFVLPSHHENFGIAVVEAIAAGLPVVVAPEVQLADFVARNALGVVAAREAGALARAILRTLTDTALRERCAARGPALVAQTFAPAAVGAQLLELYRRAAGPSADFERGHVHPGHQRVSR